MSNHTVKDKTVLFIYTSLPGYMFSCIDRLAMEIPYKIIVIETDSNINYPIKYSSRNFDIINYSDFNKVIGSTNNEDIKKVIITGWANQIIRSVANYFFKRNVRMLLLSDQARKNNIKQRFGKLILKTYLDKFEKIIVPGKSGLDLMLYYGVSKEHIITGLYSADQKIFNEAKNLRDIKPEYPKSFLFDGQFIDRKGIRFLINDYLNYRKLSKNPWDLIMVGKGNLENIIPEEIRNLGFVEQSKLKEVYENAGCFVLPSFEDHWGVVIHQAAAAGLPLIISPYCYSHLEFFEDKRNGYFIDPHIHGSLKKSYV